VENGDIEEHESAGGEGCFGRREGDDASAVLTVQRNAGTDEEAIQSGYGELQEACVYAGEMVDEPPAERSSEEEAYDADTEHETDTDEADESGPDKVELLFHGEGPEDSPDGSKTCPALPEDRPVLEVEKEGKSF